MSRDVLRVAAVQLSSQDDLNANLDACERAVRAAADSGASLVVLPENCAWFGSERRKAEIAERLGDHDARIQGRFGALARERRVTLIAGGMPEISDDRARPYNTCVVFDAFGQVSASYRKIHLFDVEPPGAKPFRESQHTSPGCEPQVVDVDGVRIGLSICYDLRFPELYRQLVHAGAEVLLVPAAFTLQTGKDHWHLLLRARAVESTAWVVAANQWGTHPEGRACYGHSMIVDPWGVVVAECSDRPGFVTAELDFSYLEQVRDRLPSLKHRRLA